LFAQGSDWSLCFLLATRRKFTQLIESLNPNFLGISSVRPNHCGLVHFLDAIVDLLPRFQISQFHFQSHKDDITDCIHKEWVMNRSQSHLVPLSLLIHYEEVLLLCRLASTQRDTFHSVVSIMALVIRHVFGLILRFPAVNKTKCIVEVIQHMLILDDYIIEVSSCILQ
jgi:hypothetical protein